MGTTADKLNYLNNTKNLIKNAIVNKGQTVNSGDSFRSFASKIENIQTGVDLNDYFALNPTHIRETLTSLLIRVPSEINFTNVTNMAQMFSGFYNLTTVPNFNTSNVTNMWRMFKDCSNLTTVPNFDTSNVTDMAEMFSSCTYRLLEIPNFNTSKVTNMASMFSYCRPLINAPNLIFINGVNAYSMFEGCSNLTNISKLHFNIQNVFSSCYSMFRECSNLTVSNLNWSININIATGMFTYCDNLISISNFGEVNIADGMFTFCENLTDVAGIKNIYNATKMFGNCYKLKNVSNFSFVQGVNVQNMFTNCRNLTTITNFDTSKITSMVNFFASSGLKNAPNFNTSNVTTMARMFENCQQLVNVPEMNTSKVTSMLYTFRLCNNLSDAAIQNIINMCLNSKITSTTYKNLSNANSSSVFYSTNIMNTRYQNRWTELTAAGWNY